MATFIALCIVTYDKANIYSLDIETLENAIRRLHKYNVLSISALASITESSPYRVEFALRGLTKPQARGKLNPLHLTMMLYGLSMGTVPARWVREMVENGTSLSTIGDLTGISESTLHRKRSEDVF